jgi:pantoate--beta-alanine ligase
VSFTPGQATVYTEIDSIGELTRAMRKAGRPVVLVPTMGALHEGHLALVRAAQQLPRALVVVSVFVNPAPVRRGGGPRRVPADPGLDVEKLAAAGVDAVFAPSPGRCTPTVRGPR